MAASSAKNERQPKRLPPKRLPLDNAGFSLHHESVTGKEVIQLLKAKGWQLARIEGSHHILVRGTETISVPVHGKRNLKKGTLNALLKQGGLK